MAGTREQSLRPQPGAECPESFESELPKVPPEETFGVFI